MTIRPWPDGVTSKEATSAFFAAYRAAFDADPGATFACGEKDGVTVAVAVGYRAEQLQSFLRSEWHAEIQRKAAKP